jgi:cellulose synthase/poly-beta-1,6-N-acetylglucosamine synthase-like glycosyltransferase
MANTHTEYLKLGRATELTGKDYFIYRALEILPGALAWITLASLFYFSAYYPVFSAYFIIAFSVYWILKTTYLSVHLRHNWQRLKYNMSLDWNQMLSHLKYEHIRHLILLPYYNESYEVIEKSIQSLLDARYNSKSILVVLAGEERAGVEARENGEKIQALYAHHFGAFLLTSHPSGIEGEMPGKGSNITYAAEQARIHILDKLEYKYEDVIVSAFDVDSVAYPDYFNCLTWNFLTVPDPLKVSFQPVPFYNNNIWDAPALSRVAATSSTFWQMVQQERPEKLATFSSHAVSFKALYDIGYWQVNMVSEDSRIYWNLFVANDGNYDVVPISYPVSMDANLDGTFWKTIRNIYKQHRRWGYGCENIPYILFNFIKNKKIPLRKKLSATFVQVEGFWSLATNPLIIFLLGWLPVLLGGQQFNSTVLSYNLPFIARDLMLFAMSGLILSAWITLSLLPPAPKETRKNKKIFMVLQWVLFPINIIVFSAIPGLEAQTRLMLGKYMGFWVTPKHRK